jgi:hypothetical protein
MAQGMLVCRHVVGNSSSVLLIVFAKPRGRLLIGTARILTCVVDQVGKWPSDAARDRVTSCDRPLLLRPRGAERVGVEPSRDPLAFE